MKCNCDKTLAKKWYRLVGPAGTQLPTSNASEVDGQRLQHGKEICKTHAAGYMTAPHPTIRDGIVSRNVCFEWSGNCNGGEVPIQVAACADDFGRNYYVYELVKTTSCSLAYCELEEKLKQNKGNTEIRINEITEKNSQLEENLRNVTEHLDIITKRLGKPF